MFACNFTFILTVFVVLQLNAQVLSKDECVDKPVIHEVTPVDCSTVTDSNHVFMSWQVDEPPQFQGGEKAYHDYLSHHLEYPGCGGELGARTWVGFVIDRDGHIVNPEIRRGTSQYIDRAVLGIFKEMPPWIPGKYRGTPVNVTMVLAVVIDID